MFEHNDPTKFRCLSATQKCRITVNIPLIWKYILLLDNVKLYLYIKEYIPSGHRHINLISLWYPWCQNDIKMISNSYPVPAGIVYLITHCLQVYHQNLCLNLNPLVLCLCNCDDCTYQCSWDHCLLTDNEAPHIALICKSSSTATGAGGPSIHLGVNSPSSRIQPLPTGDGHAGFACKLPRQTAVTGSLCMIN